MTTKPPCSCAYCGKPAVRKTTRVWNPFSSGSREERILAEAEGLTKATWRYRGNQQVLRRDWADPAKWGSSDARFLHWVTIWDGESWMLGTGRSSLFCTVQCAELFAEASYRAGMRMQKRDAA